MQTRRSPLREQRADQIGTEGLCREPRPMGLGSFGSAWVAAVCGVEWVVRKVSRCVMRDAVGGKQIEVRNAGGSYIEKIQPGEQGRSFYRYVEVE